MSDAVVSVVHLSTNVVTDCMMLVVCEMCSLLVFN